MVKFLLERGADLTARISDGSTALPLAERKKSGMQSAPNAGWNLAKNANLDAGNDLLNQATGHPPKLPTAATTVTDESAAAYAHFERWGLSFDYPPEWEESPANEVAQMKDHLAGELRPAGRVNYVKGTSVANPPARRRRCGTQQWRPKPDMENH